MSQYQNLVLSDAKPKTPESANTYNCVNNAMDKLFGGTSDIDKMSSASRPRKDSLPYDEAPRSILKNRRVSIKSEWKFQ